MPTESSPPKYAAIIDALRSRIIDTTYQPGDMLPSEAQLVREFGASRSTVVRALEYLRQHGWLEGVQGKGRVVLGRPASPLTSLPRRAHHLLRPGTFTDAALLTSGRAVAPPHVASALGQRAGAQLVTRRYLLTPADGRPVGLTAAYVDASLADEVQLHADSPMADNLVPYLEAQRGVIATQVIEQVGARIPSAFEATALDTDRRHCLATVLLTVLDAADQPILAVDALIARDAVQLSSLFKLP
ncbi:GntR family transcriptional regulator [Dactylosporangium sp. NPDC000555]|uniref:GntR family transcriptional regulator n=1 Tax=Dactylosporangium sp. NPDC000555 TaxID=3154260 RepID=UPI00332CE7B1